MKKFQIGVMGYAGLEEYPKNCGINPKVYNIAYEVGKLIASKGWILLTGGKSGIMQEASRGCKENNGITVGVVCGTERFTSNEYVDIEVIPGTYPSGETSTLITMSDALIILGGGMGTLQEITIAYRLNKPMFSIKGLGGWSGKLETMEMLDERDKYKIIFKSTAVEVINEVESYLKTLAK